MPIIHKYRGIFFHVPKCAGSSIECKLGVYIPNNRFNKSVLFGGDLRHPFLGSLQHLTPNEALSYKYITPANWQKYFKFAFVRNPWDRAVSEYEYQQRGKTNVEITFEDFVAQIPTWSQQRGYRDGHFCPQHNWLRIDGKLVLDFVGRYERLADDFTVVCQRLGIKNTTLPKINTTEHMPYRTYYTDKLKDIIYHTYKEDIVLLNYEF